MDKAALLKITGSKPVAIFGLGASGLAVVRAMTRNGIKAIAWDDKEESHSKAKNLGADVIPLDAKILKECAFLILAPGVPLDFPAPHPVVLAAREAGIKIIGDIELFNICHPEKKFIGITGTNGKSTTTALIAHTLKSVGLKIPCGGNIGKSVFDLEVNDDKGWILLELSSFQLDLCPNFSPDISVLLNITPDHIDRHGTLENYIASKQKIFRGAGLAIIATDDRHTKKIANTLKAGARQVITVSKKFLLPFENKNLNLRGAHNIQNMQIARAVCTKLGLTEAQIEQGFQTYNGLPHRQHLIRTIKGVQYINDSKATNAEAAATALAAYKNIYWIVGGTAKKSGLKGLEQYTPNITHAFLIGATPEQFVPWISEQKISFTISGTLEKAVEAAHKITHNKNNENIAYLPNPPIILLSPACASYDQFKSFEHRGNQFETLVKNLK